MKTFEEMIEACWKGYKKVGMKKKGDKVVPNCVPEEVEQIDELSKGTLRKYGDAAHEQESDIRYTLKRTEKSKHISAGAKDELRKLADRRKAGIKLAADKRGYYKGTDAKYNFTHGDAKVHATEEVELDEAGPHGMSDKEYARHELGKAKKPEVKVGAKVSVTGGGSGVVQKIYDKELHNGQKRKFIHLKDNQGRDFHHRYYAHRVRVLEEVEQTDEQAPVAPTLDRKYLKGTPEHKAYKASKVRQKFRLVYKDGKLSVKEDVEQIDESGMMMAAAALLHNQPRYIERTAEQEKKRAEREAEKALHTPGKAAAKRRKYWVKKVNKLHGIPEETDRNQRLRDALAKIKNDFSNPPAGHKEAEPSKPASAPKPKTGGGMPYYPDSRGGRRYMGDSVEMDGNSINEMDGPERSAAGHGNHDPYDYKKGKWAAAKMIPSKDATKGIDASKIFSALQKKKKIKEESEQIDELSKDTLASYNRKAWDDRQANQHKTAELSKKPLLYRGKTYTKNERDDAEKTHNELRKLAHRHGTRTKGIETSEKKWMAKEEVEVSESSHIHAPGTKVNIPHKGKSVTGKVVRYDKGAGGYSPAYVVHVSGEYESPIVPAHKVKKVHEEVEQIDEQKHRVNVTVSDPNHSAVSKRNETVQKFVRLSAADEKSAVEKAKAHYKSKGFKVHSAEHAGMVNESTQLDEISAKTLTSYIDKASHDHSKHRGKNILLARRKLMKKPLPPIQFAHKKIQEATYQGKEVPLNKPMAGDVKKSKVYVDPDGDGTAQKVNFGDKNMTIKKNIPARRKSFRARHNCENPGPKNKARYWSCRAW